ncbi:MAG: hypothetical protein ABIQ31_02905 [Ferruginibacter sp.]
MRAIFIITILLSVTQVKAQTMMPVGIGGFFPGERFANSLYTNDSLPEKKWSLTRYNAISTSFSFFRGGNATIFSAPMGLQLNRRLNNNLYAFANISVAPAYINFNSSFSNTNLNKTNQGGFLSGSNSLGIYTAASMGLMYINDSKTFSISGSISVEKSSYPLLPMYQNNTSSPARFIPSKR